MTIENYVNPLTRESFVPFTKTLKGRQAVIFDTETTGLDKDDEIVELSIINGYGDELYHSMFKPEKEISPEASQKTGIVNADLVNEPLFKDEFTKILSLLAGGVAVGHNVGYDIRMLKQTAERYGLPTGAIDDLSLSSFDTCSIARKQMQSENYRLETLYRMITGDTEEQKHRATYDCLWTLILLRYLEENWHEVEKVKKGTFEDAKPLILAKTPLADVAAKLHLSMYTVEKYVARLFDEGLVKQSDFMTKEQAESIYNGAIGMPSDWDGKMKPLKEALPEEISYLMINLMYKGNGFKEKVIAERAAKGIPAPSYWALAS